MPVRAGDRSRPIRRVTWPPDAPRVGLHLGVATGLLKAATRARQIGCRALQIFSDNPTAWRRRASLPRDVEAFIAYRERARIDPLVVHASYLINLAGRAEPFARQSLAALIHELRRAPLYGASIVNVHIGSHRHEGEEAGLAQIATNVRAAVAEAPDGVRLTLENSTGGGDELGASLESIARIVDLLGDAADRVAFCLDTAHLWGAGYDLSSAEDATAIIERFSALIGLDRLALIHLNDSKAPLGSRWDRHEHVGAGRIGPAGLGALLRHPALRETTFILETPGVDEGYDATNMRRARALFMGATALPKLPAAAFRLKRRSTRTFGRRRPATVAAADQAVVRSIVVER
ncbi:MAG: deoxyribonuclease IV [Candidatus Limnocylindria bacterium]